MLDTGRALQDVHVARTAVFSQVDSTQGSAGRGADRRGPYCSDREGTLAFRVEGAGRTQANPSDVPPALQPHLRNTPPVPTAVSGASSVPASAVPRLSPKPPSPGAGAPRSPRPARGAPLSHLREAVLWSFGRGRRPLLWGERFSIFTHFARDPCVRLGAEAVSQVQRWGFWHILSTKGTGFYPEDVC